MRSHDSGPSNSAVKSIGSRELEISRHFAGRCNKYLMLAKGSGGPDAGRPEGSDIAMTFVSIYAFAAPIGAILTTHVLLEKRDL
jgi:hypothetical protein